MATPRRKHPFWRRNDPAIKFDIVKLRPKTLPRGKRFESLNDARRESIRSENLLDVRNNGLSVYLKECREGDYRCEKSYCPQCARTFRRWFIAESLRLTSSFREPVTIFTVLLESAPLDNLQDLNIENYRHSLRKRLDRAGLSGTPVIDQLFFQAGYWIEFAASKRYKRIQLATKHGLLRDRCGWMA